MIVNSTKLVKIVRIILKYQKTNTIKYISTILESIYQLPVNRPIPEYRDGTKISSALA